MGSGHFLDIKQLRYFVKIAEQGSFSQGARMLHVAQPALSHHIRQLEDELGVQLLERHARGVRLTEPGQRLLDHARLVLRQLETAREEVADLTQTPRGTVRVGLATAVSTVLTVPLIEAARRRVPEIDLKVVETMSGFIKEWVSNGRIDLAVLYNVDGHENFRIEPLLHEDLCLVAPPEATLAADPLPFAALAEMPLILPSTAHGLRLLVDSFAAARGIPLRVVLDMDSTAQIIRLVGRGHGFSVLSPAAVHAAAGRGEVREVHIVEPTVTRSVVFASREGWAGSRALDAVRVLIVEVVRQLVADGVWRARFLA